MLQFTSSFSIHHSSFDLHPFPIFDRLLQDLTFPRQRLGLQQLSAALSPPQIALMCTDRPICPFIKICVTLRHLRIKAQITSDFILCPSSTAPSPKSRVPAPSGF